jgi:hypothetical protein
VKFVDGYPGKLYVVGRKKGDTWYVAGINGEDGEKQVILDLSFLVNRKGEIFSSGHDDENSRSFEKSSITIPADGKIKITLKGNDGFVGVFK